MSGETEKEQKVVGLHNESTSLLSTVAPTSISEVSARTCTDACTSSGETSAMNTSPMMTSISENVNHARSLLYLSHLFAKGSDIAWQFCLVLFLAAFSGYRSLVLVSTYGLCAELSTLFLGGYMGKFVDSPSINRLTVARIFLWLQNLCVIVATAQCYRLLGVPTTNTITNTTDFSTMHTETDWSVGGWIESRFYGIPSTPSDIWLLVGIHVLASAAGVLDKGITVAMERDWIVVMADTLSSSDEKTASSWLTDTNLTMKQIDLGCKSAAPAVAGIFVASFGPNAPPEALQKAAIMVGALNVACLVVEYVATVRIYHLIPALAVRSLSTTTSSLTTTTTPRCRFTLVPPGFSIYLKQEMALGGIALSLLYLNMLTFGGIMTAYLVYRGMRLDVIGLCRGLSAFIGLMGTELYRFFVGRGHTLKATGLTAIGAQFSFLSLSYVSLFVGNNDDSSRDAIILSLTLLILGVCFSRIGLYVFDLSVTQLMQETVPEPVRGTVGGVQQSLNAFFGTVMYIVGICLPDPSQFYITVIVGYSGVGVALLLYLYGVFLKRTVDHKFDSLP